MEFVAEIGSNHKGIKSLVYEMIRVYSQAGATICKFQLGHPRPLPEIAQTMDTSTTEYMRYIPIQWVEDLAQWCDDFGVEFMASIWSQEGLDAARSVGMHSYKIAHQVWDNPHPDWLKEAMTIKNDKYVSTSKGNTEGDGIAFLYCSPEYPQYDMQMPSTFGWQPEAEYLGYSSHMHGISDALVAISRGAKYVEKHVTLDKTEESIKDNSFAISPQEFATMVQLGKEIHRLTS